MTPEIADVTIRLEATANTLGAALGKVATRRRQYWQPLETMGSPSPTSVLAGRRTRSWTHIAAGIIGYAASHTLVLRLTHISAAPTMTDSVAEAAGDTFRLERFRLPTPR